MTKNNNEANVNREREFTVVLEGLRSDFRVFGDGLDILSTKVEVISTKVEVLNTNQGRVWEKIVQMESSINKRFDSVESRLERLEITRA